MPYRRRSSEVMVVTVAGAVLWSSAVCDAVVTTGSASAASRSEGPSARATPESNRAEPVHTAAMIRERARVTGSPS